MKDFPQRVLVKFFIIAVVLAILVMADQLSSSPSHELRDPPFLAALFLAGLAFALSWEIVERVPSRGTKP